MSGSNDPHPPAIHPVEKYYILNWGPQPNPGGGASALANVLTEKLNLSEYQQTHSITYLNRSRQVEEFNDAIISGYHIVQQTSGVMIDDIRRDIDRSKRLGYFVVLVFPMVPENDVLARVPPRFSKQQIIEELADIVNNARSLLPLVDTMYIYDNSLVHRQQQGEEPEDDHLVMTVRRRSQQTHNLLGETSVNCNCSTARRVERVFGKRQIGGLIDMCTMCNI